MENRKYKDLAKNTLLFTISSFGSKILVFLLVPLYTNVLSTSEYGNADLITTTATLLNYILTINISEAVLRFSIEKEQNSEQYIRYGINVVCISSIVLFLGLCIVSQTNIITWDYTLYIFLFFQYISLSFYQLFSNYLRAIDDVKGVAISGALSTAITVCLNIVLLLVFKTGLLGYLVSLVSGGVVATLFCITRIRRRIPAIVSVKVSPDTSKKMNSYSIPMIFNNVAWWINNSLDKYFVTGIIGTAANGIYAVSYKIPTILSMAHSVFSQAWNLSAIKEFDKSDKDGFFSKTYNSYNTLLILACSVLVIFNIPLAKMLYAKEFFVAWKYSSILLLSMVFNSLSGFLGSVFTAVKDTKIFAVSTVVAAITNCLLNAVLIPLYGAMGAAVATLLSFVIIWIIRLICTKKYIHIKFHILSDILCYGLLVVQIVIGLIASDGFLYQVAILITLIIINKSRVLALCQLLMDRLIRRNQV